MRLLVDYVPTRPQDCMFYEELSLVEEDVLENAIVCEDCGGFMISDDDVNFFLHAS